MIYGQQKYNTEKHMENPAPQQGRRKEQEYQGQDRDRDDTETIQGENMDNTGGERGKERVLLKKTLILIIYS